MSHGGGGGKRWVGYYHSGFADRALCCASQKLDRVPTASTEKATISCLIQQLCNIAIRFGFVMSADRKKQWKGTRTPWHSSCKNHSQGQ